MPYGTLNVDKIVNDNGVTFAGLYGFKNRIINGAMMIDQRNAGASVSLSGLAVTYTLDRWAIRSDTDAVVSIQQSSVAPNGFTNSLLYTVTTADSSLGASQNYSIQQRIEGFNMSDFGWGTASAQTVTLSFWVRSSLTGTFGGAVANSAANRSYPFTYTISAANTWEQKTVTIAGDTSGTWLTTNGIGAYIYFSTGAGSTVSGTAGAWAGSDFRSATGATSVVGTNGATFYITGVQLERGSTATSFDFRPYGTELMLCQRYFISYTNASGQNEMAGLFGSALSTTGASICLSLPVEMRTRPTIAATLLTLADGVNAAINVTSVSLRTDVSNSKLVFYESTVASGLTQFRPYYVRFATSSSGSIQLSAEL